MLENYRVLDLSRNAPGPFASMLLADLGAEVISIGGGRAGDAAPVFGRGKTQITVDLKSESGAAAFRALLADADVVIEGFRPGVAGRIGADYETVSTINPRLVYCSLTGYGQSGPLSQVASHDINYLALSGLLGAIGPIDAEPVPPLNIVADMAGGGVYAALGIVSALLRRETTGEGAQIDASMLDGVLSMMAMCFGTWGTAMAPGRGQGLVSGEAPFYRCYVCQDGGYIAIGAVEPQFFRTLWEALELPGEPVDHLSRTTWPELTRTLEAAFAARPRDHWTERLLHLDCCATPVLAPDEVWSFPHIAERHPGAGMFSVPLAPRIDAETQVQGTDLGDRTEQILLGAGVDAAIVGNVLRRNAESGANSGGITWPPVQE